MEKTKQFLDTLLDYKDGHLFWKKKTGKKIIVGQRAGTQRPDGYRHVRIEGKYYQEHIIIWCIYYGEWPTMCIDHKNTVRNDNKIENLRLATRVQNSANMPKFSTNTSGYKGVSFNKKSKKFVAYLNVNKVRKHLGAFDTVEAARLAHKEASIKYLGEFVNKEVAA